MLEIKNTIAEKKNTLERINSIFERAEENTSILEKYTKCNKRKKFKIIDKGSVKCRSISNSLM